LLSREQYRWIVFAKMGCSAYWRYWKVFSSANPFEFDPNQVGLLESVVDSKLTKKKKLNLRLDLCTFTWGGVYSFTSPWGGF